MHMFISSLSKAFNIELLDQYCASSHQIGSCTWFHIRLHALPRVRLFNQFHLKSYLSHKCLVTPLCGQLSEHIAWEHEPAFIYKLHLFFVRCFFFFGYVTRPEPHCGCDIEHQPVLLVLVIICKVLTLGKASLKKNFGTFDAFLVGCGSQSSFLFLCST